MNRYSKRSDEMKKAILKRHQDTGKQTLGHLIGFNGLEKVFESVTLELPDKDNEKSISCIPRGTYHCVLIQSSNSFKYPHYLVKDVYGRTAIKIHIVNFYTQIEGCIGIGKKFANINNDGELDITNSKNTLSDLVQAMGNEFLLTIV